MNSKELSRIRIATFLIPLIAACLSLAISASAGVDPGAKCATSKQKAAAKKLSEKVKCHGTAIKKGIAVDAACLTKAEDKYEASFAKAEEKGGCATVGDVDDIEALIDQALADLLDALPASTPTTTLPPDEVCNNQVDDDGDGATDCVDSDCVEDASCIAALEVCNNGQDDDGDGATDCADSDCVGDSSCIGEVCNNQVDDDLDGETDCADSDCVGDPSCN